ncbi:hypothetical protein AB833_30585 [Chromatiales bacterium (ex Bugula neritina AB1)]|nr:hypothetical protein AB833_30585 [Chromatiales bacterium (ex Bugula neritina AB1)]
MIEQVKNHGSSDTVPVLIIGSGACGLTAALAARQSGAEVVVLERDITPHGSTGMSYGAICAAGTRLQQAEGIDDNAEDLTQDILTATRELTCESLAALIAENSAPVVDWMTEELGFELTVETAWTGLGHRQPRLHAPAGRSGVQLMGMLLRACEDAGVIILTQARMTELLVQADDTVYGVRFERPDGSTETVNCQTVILATCGFGANSKWVDHYIPDLSGARYFGHEGNDGGGIEQAMALGAAVDDMGSYQSLGSLADPESLVIPHTLMISGGVQINTNGKRFENELEDISGQALTILEQPAGICWIVYDQTRHEAALANFQDYKTACEMKAPKHAPSWLELSKLMQVPAAALEETMNAVASHCRHQTTDEFGRPFNTEAELQAPYFAIRVTGALFHTQGGLLVNNEARVVKTDGRAMPNLFAGGGAARSVSGPGGWGYLPGMGLCTAVTLGYLAGRNAAEQCRNSAANPIHRPL